MTELQLITASVLGPVAKIIEQANGPRGVRKAFKAAEIPFSAVQDQHLYAPYKSIALMLEHSARAAGDPHLGAQIGRGFRFNEVGTYGQYITQAPTLKVALERAERATPYITNSEKYGIEDLGDQIRLTYDSGIRGCVGSQHVDLCSLLMVIDVIRQFGGEHWNPVRMEFDHLENSSESFLEDVFQAPIVSGCQTPAIVLEANLLGRTNINRSTFTDHVTFSDLRQMVKSRPRKNLCEVVREVARLRIREGQADLDGLAQQLKVGPRMLQRHLEVEGTTYRHLIQEVRCERACELLLETQESVSNISKILGYTFPPQFVRAFRRWTGTTPQQFREQNSNAD